MLKDETQESLVYRLRKRAEIRSTIQSRKSVQNNEPDKIVELLMEAADRIESLESILRETTRSSLRYYDDENYWQEWQRN